MRQFRSRVSGGFVCRRNVAVTETCREVVYSDYDERFEAPMNAAWFAYPPARLGFISTNTFLNRSM